MRDAVAELATNLGRDLLRARLLGKTPPMVDNRYRVERILGRGASGVVVEAWDSAVGLPRALKIAPVGTTTAGAYAEARTLMQLEDAANVVRVYHVDRAPLVTCTFETPIDFVSMKLVSGSTLRTWLATHRPSTAQAFAKFVDVARGLAAAHALGIVHGDVKTDNVMVDEHGRAMLLDFGFAAQIRNGQAGVQRSVAAGTGPYLAPEVLKGTVRRRSDVYSFAVSLWEAWTGVLPFREGRPELRLFGGVKNLQRAESLPPRLRETLRTCFHPNPAKRPSMVELLALLEQVNVGLAHMPTRTRRGALPLSVAAVASLVAAAVVFVPTMRWRTAYTLRDKLGVGSVVTLRLAIDPELGERISDGSADCVAFERADLRFRRFGSQAKLSRGRVEWNATDVDWSSDGVRLRFDHLRCRYEFDLPIARAAEGRFEFVRQDDGGTSVRRSSGTVTVAQR